MPDTGHRRLDSAIQRYVHSREKGISACAPSVATISIHSSIDSRFPAQGHDVRAAVRWLREDAAEYGIDPKPTFDSWKNTPMESAL